MFAKLVDYYNKTGFKTKETLCEHALNQEFWAYLRERPPLHADFLSYMKGRKDGLPRWLDYFPVQTQVADLQTDSKAVTLVDVGGNLGHDVQVFQQRCPDIPGRLILMDLPETIKGNTSSLPGIEKMEYDFFTPQPIQGIITLLSIPPSVQIQLTTP